MHLPLFAFGISNLPMLGWLAVAAAPILIHLWSRRKYREMSWAAMEYLLAAARRQRRRLLIEQWLLLAVRTLVVALVVLAVAEPYFDRPGLAPPSMGQTHRMLVLDASYSMGYKPTDKTRFERAKELARQIVEESPQGDVFTLALMADPPRLVVATPALEPGEVIREIDDLQIASTAADLPATIAAVAPVIEAAGRDNRRLIRHEIYFLTDMQRETWAPRLSPGAAAEFLRQSKALAEAASLSLIDVGQPSAENLAVVGIRTLDPLMIVGRDVRLAAEVRNFGRQSKPRQTVELLVDRRRIEQKELNVPAGGTAAVAFAYRFDDPGDHRVEVHVPGDALEIDDRRCLIAPVRRAIRTLCIDGRRSQKTFGGAADYLAAALAPFGTMADRGWVQTEIASENALLDRGLAGYDCVFLCNVAQFTPSEVRVLDAYLQGGGSLVFFLGDQVSAERYNHELGPAGQGRAGEPGILPAKLAQVVEQPQFRLDPLQYRHPILQTFRGRGETSLLTTPILKYFRLEVPDRSTAQTVLAMANGDPLVVEQPVHRGCVVLAATSADPAWSALPLWPSFVPLVHEIVAYCVGHHIKQRNLIVGEPIEASLAIPASEAALAIQLPDGRTRPVQLRSVGDFATFRYDDTSQNGVYSVKLPPPADRSQLFAVNLDTAESNLETVDPEQLRNDVWPGVPFVHQTTWQDLGPTAPGSVVGSVNRLHVVLLYAVLGLLMFETFLAWKMGHSEP